MKAAPKVIEGGDVADLSELVVGRKRRMRSNRVACVGGTLTIALALTSLLTAAATQGSQVVSARAGLVTRVEGEVRCHHHEREGGVEELRVGDRLHDDDIVFTNETGSTRWTLNPDSYLTESPGSTVRVYDTSLDRMSFGVERGEVVIVARSLGKDISLTIRTPPGPLTVHKAGLYRFRVSDDGGTVAEVVRGELRYTDEAGKLNVVKKGRSVTFREAVKNDNHGP